METNKQEIERFETGAAFSGSSVSSVLNTSFASLGGGANQAGGRAYNERLTLSLIRLNGPLPKAELARLTGLSAQTLSQIVRRLEADGLLLAQPALRGRVGQPSVPYALNPLGVLSFGVKIGRRSTDIVLCDFTGRILDRLRQRYACPLPHSVLDFITSSIASMRMQQKTQRIAGIGIAMPFELWKWAKEVDAPEGSLDGWRDMDVTAILSEQTGLPVFIANDASAACGAELAYNHRGSNIDLLYLFIGSFAGGGVVLNGMLFQGRSGNAGALGSMPIFKEGRRSQLIQQASLITLEHMILADGGDATLLQDPDANWSKLGSVLDRWLADASDALATTVVAASSVIDFGQVAIDGAMPRSVLGQLLEQTRAAVRQHDLQGLNPFDVSMGSLGADARALGGAMLPINEGFGSAQDVLLKTPVSL